MNLGIARDTPESLREHFAAALDCDLLVTTAGISVGEHDYVRPVLDELGADAAILEAADAARRAGRLRAAAASIPWIGLPGQSGEHDGDVRAVRPAGHPEDVRARPALPPRRAGAAGRAGHASSRSCSTSCAPSSAEGPGGLEARLTGPQGSGILTSMVLANALLVIPEGQFDTPAGAAVQAIRLDDPEHQPEPGFCSHVLC